MCKELYKTNQVHLDHINPVVDVKSGWVDWNSFIDRLFCTAEEFQVLCSTCHDAKTKIEDAMRVHFTQEKKKNGKPSR